MTWHDELSTEVEVEFQRLCPRPFDRITDALWQASLVDHWSGYGLWWRRTVGLGYVREYQRARIARLKTTFVAVRGCVACGKPFELSAYRHSRGRDRVCSMECRGAARRNIELVAIGGVSKTLTRWAEEYGVPLGTVWMRIKRGWEVERALSAPPANRGQIRKSRAA